MVVETPSTTVCTGGQKGCLVHEFTIRDAISDLPAGSLCLVKTKRCLSCCFAPLSFNFSRSCVTDSDRVFRSGVATTDKVQNCFFIDSRLARASSPGNSGTLLCAVQHQHSVTYKRTRGGSCLLPKRDPVITGSRRENREGKNSLSLFLQEER